MQGLGREFLTLLRFVSVGMLATLVHVLVGLAAVTLFKAPLQIANFVAFASSFPVSFIGHYRLTFRSKRPYRVAFPRFILSAVLAFGASSLALWGLDLSALLPSELKILMAAAVIPATMYVLGRLWVY